MKILLATFWIIPHVGGVWNYMTQLKKKLESLGHEVDLLGYGESNTYVYIVNEFRKVERIDILPLIKKQPENRSYLTDGTDPMVKYCETERIIYELGATYLGLDQYDVINTQDVISTGCISKVKPKHTPLIATLHGCVAHEMRRQLPDTDTTNSARFYFDELEYIGATSADYTIVANNWLKNILIDEFHVPNQQLKISHYGFDTKSFLTRLEAPPPFHLQPPVTRPSNKKIIVYTGRLIELKGVHDLISALSQLKKIRNDWICWIVGEGEKEGELLNQSRRLGLEEHILFLGKRYDIPYLLSNSDIFVLPSLIENQPLSVIEAQLAGKSIIVSDAGGLPEIVQDGVTGLVSPAGEPQVLCKNLELLLKDKAYREKLGSNAKEWSLCHWSLDSGVERILDIYNSAISKAQNRADIE